MLIKGIFWDFTDKFLNQGITFIVSIFLARILAPEDFGLVGMVMVFVSFSQVFMDIGFSTALIQKQEVSEEQFSTVFYLNIILGLALTCLFFVLSDIIAAFYDHAQISALIKGVSVLFLINSLSIVQNTKYLKAINLKPLAIFRGIAVIISGAVGILMAYNEYGVWSLIAQSIVNALIFTILIWFGSKWRPILYFNLHCIKDLWSYGSRIFLPNLLEVIFSRLDVLIIGKLFNPTSLGYYTRAQSLNSLVIHYSSGSIMKVFFPAISKYQNDSAKVKEIYLIVLAIVAFAALGLLSVLFVSSESIIVILFGNKWLQSVDYFKILVLGGFAYPLSSVMVNIISGLGNSKAYLRLDLIKKFILLAVFIIGFQIGIMAFLYGLLVFSTLAVVINMHFVSKEIKISVLDQIKLVLPYFVASLIACLVGIVVSNSLSLPLFGRLVVEASVVIISYLGFNYIIRTQALNIIRNKISTLGYSKA
jgi:teichuronic acid exporter